LITLTIGYLCLPVVKGDLLAKFDFEVSVDFAENLFEHKRNFFFHSKLDYFPVSQQVSIFKNFFLPLAHSHLVTNKLDRLSNITFEWCNGINTLA